MHAHRIARVQQLERRADQAIAQRLFDAFIGAGVSAGVDASAGQRQSQRARSDRRA